MIRYATVGTSAITEKFIAACKLTGRFELSSVYSRKVSTGVPFADRMGCNNVVTKLSSLAKDKNIDAVYIASPNSLHFAQSKLMLEHGKHVICEKPIVTGGTYYRELKHIADSHGVIYMEAMPPRFAESRDAVHEALRKIGKISSARIDYCQLSARYGELLSGKLPNIFNMSLHGGTLMDLGVYCVQGAVDLFGVPKDIYAKASFLECGADGAGTAIFDYGDFLATLTYSKIGQSAIGSEIVGDKGTLRIGMISQYADVTLIQDGVEEKICGVPDRARLLSGEADRFADFILYGKRMSHEYDEVSQQTYNVQFCMDKIKKSAGIQYKRLKKEVSI